MLTKSTIAVLLLALSVSAQGVRFIPDAQNFNPLPNGAPLFPRGDPRFANGPTTFNGLNGFFAPYYNSLNNSGLTGTGVNSTGTFNTSTGTTGTFTANSDVNGRVFLPNNFINGVAVTNGLTSLNNGGVVFGVNGINGLTGVNTINGFNGLEGTIVTKDGTFINTRHRGFLNGDLYANNRVRYANNPTGYVSGATVARVSGNPVSSAEAYLCIQKKCNNDSYPVCGADNKTYKNSCQLECFGIDFIRDGECF